ncbi:MAG: hypothetical protein PHF00_04380 [Elusimicrobia bacterium]|nr:hypothetical protein [Elusimicrobiota bacterium]
MICTACKNAEAVVFIKQLIDNQVSQAALCADCAARAHVPLGPAAPLEALLGLLGKLPPPARRLHAARCPGCGTTWQDFRAGGRLGCARCYDHFEPRLKAIIPRLHKGAYAHRGKSPGRP